MIQTGAFPPVSLGSSPSPAQYVLQSWAYLCHGQGGSSYHPPHVAYGVVDHDLSTRNMLLSASLLYSLPLDGINLGTSFRLALCGDIFYST